LHLIPFIGWHKVARDEAEDRSKCSGYFSGDGGLLSGITKVFSMNTRIVVEAAATPPAKTFRVGAGFTWW
jgi:hypothetical protein